MKRIRYRLDNNTNLLISTGTFDHPTNGAKMKIELDLPNKKIRIVDVVGGAVLFEEEGSNRKQLTDRIKRRLQTYGIPFVKEERKKNDGTRQDA